MATDFVVRISTSVREDLPCESKHDGWESDEVDSGNCSPSPQSVTVVDDVYAHSDNIPDDQTFPDNREQHHTADDCDTAITADIDGKPADNQNDIDGANEEDSAKDNELEECGDQLEDEDRILDDDDTLEKSEDTIENNERDDADDDADDEDDGHSISSGETRIDIRSSATETSTSDSQDRTSATDVPTPPLTPISIRTLTPTYSLNDSTSTMSSTPSTPSNPSTPAIPGTPSLSPTPSMSSTASTPSPNVRMCRSRTLLSSRLKNLTPEQPGTRRTQSLNHKMKRSNSGRDFNNNSFHLSSFKTLNEEEEENESDKEGAITRLLHEAVYHQNIVLQASQALNIADLFTVEGKKSTSAVIEAERILLLESERRASCLDKVKQLKECASVEKSPHCSATIEVSDMKLSLRGRGVSALLNRGGKGLHLVLLASAGHGNITTTEVVSDGWSSSTNAFTMPMTDITLNQMQHDFQLSLKLLAIWTNKDTNDIHNNNSNNNLNNTNQNNNTSFSTSSLSHSPSMRKIKEIGVNGINGILFNKKDTFDWDTNTTQSNKQPLFRKTNFKLLGETTLNLSSIRSGRTRHELDTPHHACVLELDMMTSLTPKYDVNMRGVLTFKEDVKGLPVWNARWCRIDGNVIKYWSENFDESTKEPLGTIDLRKCVESKVSLLPPSACARPYTIEIVAKRAREVEDVDNLTTVVEKGMTLVTYWICCGNEDKSSTWLSAINKQLSDYITWK